jgi:diguanylate cyclase (GGDEF)-like protein
MVDVHTVRAEVTASTAHEEAALKAAALDALHERVAVVDVDGTVLTVNHAWRQFAARPNTPGHARVAVGEDYLRAADLGTLEVPGMSLPPATGAGIRSVLMGDRPRFQCEYSLRSPGGPAWFLMVVTSLGGGGGGPVVVSHIDIAARRQIDADPTSSGTLHDPLTGLPTRTLLRDRLAMSLAQRPVDDRRTAVFVVGLEDLQVISDDLGAFVVDEVFIEVVRRLQSTVRPGDTIARIGPAQVAFVCSSVRGPIGVQAIRMRLGRVLGEPLRITGHPAPVWIKTTIGSALDGVDGVEPDGLLLAADLARQAPPPRDAA